jgi:hypothetical protein
MTAVTDVETVLSTQLPIEVEIRPSGGNDKDWQELDRGPGIIRIPAGHAARVRIRNIGDDEIKVLVKELSACPVVTYLNLAENRKVTDDGLEELTRLDHLRSLNLSSCSLTNDGLALLSAFHHLEQLNLSYCNRITDLGLKSIRLLRTLTFLDLQGCPKITNGGLARMRRNSLTIHR